MKPYNVALYLNGTGEEEGKSLILGGTVEFEHNEGQYGNGFYMVVKGLGEPFNVQGYDIRYDKDFDKDKPIPYIVNFYANKYTKKSRYELAGIGINETEPTD